MAAVNTGQSSSENKIVLLNEPVEHYEELIAKLDKDLANAKNWEVRRRVSVKYLLYLIQIFIVWLISSQFTNPWLAAIVGILVSGVLTISMKKIMQKLGYDKWIARVEEDSKKSLIENVAKQWSFMPDILKEQVDTAVFELKGFVEGRKRKEVARFHDYMIKYIEARRLIRKRDYCGAKAILDSLIVALQKKTKYELIYSESQACLDPIKDKL